MRKILLSASTALFIILLIAIGVSYKAVGNINSRLQQSQDTKTLGVETSKEEPLPIITLTIDAGDGISSSYKLSLQENTTAFSVLEKAREMGEIEFSVTEYDFGVMVESINGFENDPNNKSWLYFVNGESGNVAADQYLLRPGDVVQWRYMEPEF